MKAQDLRVNNYLNYSDVLMRVLVVDHDELITVEGVETGYIDGCYDTKALSPIKITDEWLLKFGFLYTNGYAYKLNGFYFIAIKVADDIGFHFRYYGLNIEIKYVHNLQNLYFALTGEELTLKQ